MITTLFLALLLAPRAAAPAAVPPTLTPDIRPTIPTDRIYLPVLASVPAWMDSTRTPTPTATATARPTATRMALRPMNEAGLKLALSVPGALVVPDPGEYRPHGPLRVAAGVTLDGRGGVTLRGEGLLLYQAHGAVIRGLTITEADGDAISVNKTANVLIERVNLSAWGDGGIDIVRTPAWSGVHIVRDSVLHDGIKALLAGHQNAPEDGQMRLRLERVRFIRCQARVPKVHRATLEVVDGLVTEWVGGGIDVQLGGHVSLIRVRFEAGKKSGARYITATGGTVTEIGTQYVPWGGAQ